MPGPKWEVGRVSNDQTLINTNFYATQPHAEPHSVVRRCDVCDKVFANRSVLYRHMKTVHHARNYACDVCSKAFKQKGHVKEHKGAVHGYGKLIGHPCDICSKRFSRKRNARKHMKTVHKESVKGE